MLSSHTNESEFYPVASSENGTVFCQEKGCTFRSHRIKQLRQHLIYCHGVEVHSRTLYFATFAGE